MKYLIRPLTQRMITKLKECRQMELDTQTAQPCPPEHFSSSLPGLYARGLIDVKKYSVKGKELHGVYLTRNGINCLAYIEKFQSKV